MGKTIANINRSMDELKDSSQAASFEQKDPLLVYKFESFELFQQMLNEVNRQVLSLLFKADLHVPENQQNAQKSTPARDDFSSLKTRHSDVQQERRKKMEAERKVMAATGAGQPERKMTRAQRREMERKSKKKGRR